MERNEKLLAANIPEEWREDCYITEDGTIFTPRYDEDGTTFSTGEEAYAAYMAELETPPVTQPDPRDLAIAQLMRDVAVLKGGSANV